MTLRDRMFLATALVAAISVMSALPIVSVRAARQAEADLQRALENAARLVESRHAERLETTRVMARLVADLPKLKAAAATGDAPTVQPVAREYQSLLRARAVAVTDARGHPLAVAGVFLEAVRAAPAVAEVLHGRETVRVVDHPDGTLEMVTVPIVLGEELLGTLGLGYALDDALAADLRAATESDVVLALPGRVLASTLPRAHDAALVSLLGAKGPATVTLDDDQYVALARPLGGGLAVPEGPVTALVLRSRTERLRLLRTFRVGLVLAGLLGLAFAVGLSYAVARTVTRPLSAITAAMREISTTGDLARKVRPLPGWGDADTRLLASTLDSLTDALARFQHEAAMRERLSALGRMATVVAHEVRNPLLVVKASLRTLRRADLTPEGRQEALGDIEAEVARLNRIVNDVLDFTRPVRVDLAPADLSFVVREAVESLRRQDHGLRVRVHAQPSVPLLTDAERLRTVLANVLANAREAVAARGDAGGAREEWDVEVRVTGGSAEAGARAAIEVEDRGIGIAESDLPRAFDPYFTTKRAGSGLGLAIARNVVESLGGAITLRSRNGAGTLVRIELPARRPGAGDAV